MGCLVRRRLCYPRPLSHCTAQLKWLCAYGCHIKTRLSDAHRLFVLSTGTTFPNQTSSRPSTPGPAAPAAATYNFPFNSSSPAPATFEFPSSSSNNISSASNQTLNNFLDFPGSNNNNNPRPRALSDTSVRPVMTAVESQPMMPSFLGSHPSITAGHYSPSLNSHTPPLSSMGRTMANHRSNSFGSSDPIALHFNPSHDVAFNGLDNNLGADLRRARFDANRHRSSRSEDFRSASPFQPPEFLAPQAAYGQNTGYGYGGPIRAQDLMGTNMPSSIGPTRHARRLSSGSPYPERPGSVSSARPSPYPSPNGSPSHNQQGLPPSGMQDGELGSDGNPWAKVERQQVTTPATAKASEGRRKGEASFVCPVPGCGSTFTRHFNLKGEFHHSIIFTSPFLLTCDSSRTLTIAQRGEAIQVQVAWLRKGLRTPTRLQAPRGTPLES